MKNRSSKDVFIAFDEWNAWTRTFGGTDNTYRKYMIYRTLLL